MTIQLLRATVIGGSVAAAGSQHSLAEAFEAEMVSSGVASYVGGRPSRGGKFQLYGLASAAGAFAGIVDNCGNTMVVLGHNHASLPSPVTPGASPYTYLNASAGEEDLVVTGGVVTAMAFSRDGTTWVTLVLPPAPVRLSPGDRCSITYSVAPTVTAIPR